MTVQPPALDRAADLRAEPGVVDRLRADSATRAVLVRDGRVRATPPASGRTSVLYAAPGDVEDATWALIGRDASGSPLLLAALPPEPRTIDAAPDESWLGLRDLGGILDDSETELVVLSIALAGWLRDAPFCPACGGGTELRSAGWARVCLACGREHFPRTDPAVIVAVESTDGDRLLLGANARWSGRMHSCFAGFVEAGESLEQTVHREIEEEAGVRLTGLRYLSSQAWPFPRSLMIGFRATATDESAARADGEEIIDVRWFSRAEIGEALAGRSEIGLPGPSSIARALIVDWFEERA